MDSLNSNMANTGKCYCGGHKYCVCDICQRVTGEEKDVESPTEPATENPKDAIGSNKIPVHLFSAAGVYMGALAKLDGALKYGRNNFRAMGIRYTVYLDAIKRHSDALLEGENEDPDSQLHHLCHILASADILAEALAGKTLLDDRNYRGGFWRGFVTELTKHVPRLRAKHADKQPRHYTVNDNESETHTKASHRITAG
jgi:hypothetical protein